MLCRRGQEKRLSQTGPRSVVCYDFRNNLYGNDVQSLLSQKHKRKRCFIFANLFSEFAIHTRAFLTNMDKYRPNRSTNPDMNFNLGAVRQAETRNRHF